jgi:Cu(I)/Ag(I) efflux system membrane fusion protein
MAFDMAGADWLQSDPEVANPYFGGRMPKCGEVRETLGGSDRSAAGGHQHE